MTSILLPQDHVSHLYSATDIANTLNVATDIEGNDAIDAGMDATLLPCASALEGEGEYEVPYNLLGRGGAGLFCTSAGRSSTDGGGGINSPFSLGVSI